MQDPDFILPDHADSESTPATAQEDAAVKSKGDADKGDAAAKVFRGAHTNKDPKEIIKRVTQFEAHIQAAAQRFGVKTEHLRAIMAQESGGNPNADANPKKPIASAAGLMQVTGETWKEMRKLHADLNQYDFQTYKYHPRINCLFGAATLASKQGILIKAGMDKESDSFAQLTVAAYNGGEGVVKEAIAHARAAGSKNPEADCLKEEHLAPAIAKHPSVYKYYLTGGGKAANKSGSVTEAIALKFREISKYPVGVTKFMNAQTDLGLFDGKSEARGATTGQMQPPKPTALPASTAPTVPAQQPEPKLPVRAEPKEEPKREQRPAKSEATQTKPASRAPFDYEPARYHGYSLTGSVGQGGENHKADVIAVQTRLRFASLNTGAIDGVMGSATQSAITQFQRRVLKQPDGRIEAGKKTARELFERKAPKADEKPVHEKPTHDKKVFQPNTAEHDGKDAAKKPDKSSGAAKPIIDGAAQISKLVATAQNSAGGKKPGGACYFAVKHHIANAGGYGNIRNIYADPRFTPQGFAHEFADVVDAKGPADFGLERLSVSNPYDAPEGSLVVVSAGSPGTQHKTAGDISIKGPGDRFFNDGEMNYHGRKAWPPAKGRVLGVYRVK